MNSRRSDLRIDSSSSTTATRGRGRVTLRLLCSRLCARPYFSIVTKPCGAPALDQGRIALRLRTNYATPMRPSAGGDLSEGAGEHGDYPGRAPGPAGRLRHRRRRFGASFPGAPPALGRPRRRNVRLGPGLPQEAAAGPAFLRRPGSAAAWAERARAAGEPDP